MYFFTEMLDMIVDLLVQRPELGLLEQPDKR